MQGNRVKRLNSLLKEVLAEVIMQEVKDPRMAPLVTVTQVDITKDLHYAKVYISVIGSEKQARDTLEALESAAGFIGMTASKRVVMRYFPSLTFKLDTSVREHMHIDALLQKIQEEKNKRTP